VVSLAGGVGGGLFVWLGGFLSVRVIFSVPGGRDVKDFPLVFLQWVLPDQVKVYKDLWLCCM